MSKLLAMMMNKGMPSRYQEVEYIESTGTQWIDTGLTANQDTTIKCKISNTKSGTQTMMGLRDGSSTLYGIGQQSTGNLLFAQYLDSGTNSRIISNVAGNDGVVRELEFRKNEFYIDNVLAGSLTFKTFASISTIKLFTLNTSTNGSIKMYNAQVLDGNMKVLKNFIPVYDTLTQKYGMWESVQGKFCGNDGTGDFIGA